uniref:Nuclear receptor domain-containing protein n=1 Tax=Mesocestoides corti TaxID=53468 RepID=A0A5K3FX54_MESCO
MCAFNYANNEQKGRPYEQGGSCSKCPQGYNCFRRQCSHKSRNQSLPTLGGIHADASATTDGRTYVSILV